MKHQFLFVILIVLTITILFGATAAAIVVLCPPPLTDPQTKLFEACLSLMTFGAGAIIGLLGSRLDPLR